ncbi:MAG: tyrosine-type recombinase/integrase [Oscillospiraceae bacterium]|nr:tyrosine-type recombinase/integrase [Oscillospiraceae bacterium]
MNLKNLRDNQSELIQYLKKHDYDISYIACFQSVLSQIFRKSEEHGWTSYEDVNHFFESVYAPNTSRAYKSVLIAIRNFDIYGKYPDGACASLTDKSAETLLCNDFNQIIEYYKSAEHNRDWLKSKTIESYAGCAKSFFLALQKTGVTTISGITEKAILSIFLSAEGSMNKSASYCNSVKEVLRRCAENFPTGLVAKMIPIAKKHRKNIQYLSKDETQKIRDVLAITDSQLTLRDRAIGILAYYTGLRRSDIASLNLDSIDLENDIICIAQEKTQEPIEIPLKAVVGNAIYDYVTLERPKSNNPAVFLTRHHHRLSSGAMWGVSNRIMKAAEVRQGEKQRKGLHIFRHHFATTLLGNGVPQPVISGALGQKHPTSVEAYFSSDFVNLKSCAISIDKFPIAEGVLS